MVNTLINFITNNLSGYILHFYLFGVFLNFLLFIIQFYYLGFYLDRLMPVLFVRQVSKFQVSLRQFF
jgi:hypothetical protein